MMAAMGIELKQSIKVFHSLREYFLLPISNQKYTNHKNRKAYLSRQIHGYPSAGKSFKGI